MYFRLCIFTGFLFPFFLHLCIKKTLIFFQTTKNLLLRNFVVRSQSEKLVELRMSGKKTIEKMCYASGFDILRNDYNMHITICSKTKAACYHNKFKSVLNSNKISDTSYACRKNRTEKMSSSVNSMTRKEYAL